MRKKDPDGVEIFQAYDPSVATCYDVRKHGVLIGQVGRYIGSHTVWFIRNPEHNLHASCLRRHNAVNQLLEWWNSNHQ